MTFAKYFGLALCAATMAASGAATATEGGSQYPNGAEDFLVGAAPPPGFYMVNYTEFYHAGRVNDQNGNKAPVNFKLDAAADVPRFIYVTNVKILGANWAMHTLIPLVHMDYEVGGTSRSVSGLGDITVTPVILTWHFPNFHLVAAEDVLVPTGRYNKNDPVNIGANYWGFESVLAGTYLSDSGFEVSAKLMYVFNTRNNATDYRSGQAFHTDFTVAQHWDALTVGVNGYYFGQATDDNRAGANIGNRGKAFALGPAVKYDFKGVSVTGKWLHETMAENRPQGDALWVKLTLPL